MLSKLSLIAALAVVMAYPTEASADQMINFKGCKTTACKRKAVEEFNRRCTGGAFNGPVTLCTVSCFTIGGPITTIGLCQ